MAGFVVVVFPPISLDTTRPFAVSRIRHKDDAHHERADAQGEVGGHLEGPAHS